MSHHYGYPTWLSKIPMALDGRKNPTENTVFISWLLGIPGMVSLIFAREMGQNPNMAADI